MNRSILTLAALGGALAFGASTHAAPAPKPARKAPAPAVPSAAAVVARLKKDEQGVKTGRLSILSLHRRAELSPETKGAAAARDAARKSALFSQQRDYLVWMGEDWKRDITVMDAQGNVSVHYLMGHRAGQSRYLREAGHADSSAREASVGAPVEQNAADRMLFQRGSDLLEGVTWKGVKAGPDHLVLTGARADEQVTAVVRTRPSYALQKLAVSQSVLTPEGQATRGQELIAAYEPNKAELKSLEHLVYVTGAVNRAVVTTFKIEGAQFNQAIGVEEMTVRFPEGTKVTDRRFQPPLRYTQGDKDLTLAELKALSEQRGTGTARVGAPAPDWDLKALDGKSLKLSEHRGKVVLLTWFANWCGPCHAEAPVMEKEIWQKYRDQGLTVIGVNAAEREDPEKAAREFVQRHSLTYPVVLDTADEASAAYQVQALPTLALVDRKGTLRYLQRGFDRESVEDQLQKLLAER